MQKKGIVSLICLACGKKICYSNKECTFDSIKSKFDHIKKCGGGRSIFLLTSNYDIIIIDEEEEKKKQIPLYLNKFGERLNGSYTSKEFKLSNDEVQKACKTFINNSNLNY